MQEGEYIPTIKKASAPFLFWLTSHPNHSFNPNPDFDSNPECSPNFNSNQETPPKRGPPPTSMVRSIML